MNPAMLDLLRPHPTRFTSFVFDRCFERPSRRTRDTISHIRGSRPTGGDLGSIAVQRITAKAYGPDGASTMMQAVVRLNATPNGLPFEVLAWRSIAG